MRVSVLSALVALLSLAAVSVAASDACNGDDYGTAACSLSHGLRSSAHMDWPGCSNPTNWQVHNLTLHGMWPNYDQSQSGHDWPQCCQSTYGTDIDPAVAKALLPEFQTYWPNEQDPSGGDLSTSLWAHEWQKHGTCSGLPQKQYFQSAMNIELSMGTPDVISNNIGSSCALSDLQAAFNASSCSGDCMAGFSCQNQNGQQYLAGITTCWDTTLTQQICPAAVFSGDQCTDDTIYIQSF